MNATAHLPERNEDGSLPAFAWPGGYPLVYLDSEGADLCSSCANKWHEYSTELVDHYIHWEGEPVICENCGAEIKSAYGVPDSERIEREIALAEQESREISEEIALLIASQWHDGQKTRLYGFASTGAVPEDGREQLLAGIAEEHRAARDYDRLALDRLRSYLEHAWRERER